LLRAALALAVALAIQAGLGRFWPQGHRYVDAMLVPVVWYGIAGSQRSAMWIGCAAGLLQDAWLGAGTFGINGFKKTLLGFTLGGLGSRFDLNQQAGRFAAGAVTSLADSIMDPVLRRLLDQRQAWPAPQGVVIKALITGLLAAGAFGIIDSVRRRRRLRRPSR
jgi:cell shape-determining protein MreD